MKIEMDSRVFADEWALHRLASLYARAMDRNEPEILDGIFTEDAVIQTPSFRVQGLAKIRGLPAMLKERYANTTHSVCNQTVTIDGDRAEGETYCLGHLVSIAPRGGEFVLVEAVRYQDQWVRTAGTWRFSERRIVVDFSEIRPVRLSK